MSECKSRSNLNHYLNWIKTMFQKSMDRSPRVRTLAVWLDIGNRPLTDSAVHRPFITVTLGPVRDDNFMVSAASVPYMTHSPCLSYSVHTSYKYLCVSTLHAIVYDHWQSLVIKVKLTPYEKYIILGGFSVFKDL